MENKLITLIYYYIYIVLDLLIVRIALLPCILVANLNLITANNSLLAIVVNIAIAITSANNSIIARTSANKGHKFLAYI